MEAPARIQDEWSPLVRPECMPTVRFKSSKFHPAGRRRGAKPVVQADECRKMKQARASPGLFAFASIC